MARHVAETITQTSLTHEWGAMIAAGWHLTRRARRGACGSYPHLEARHLAYMVTWETTRRNQAGFAALAETAK